VSTGSDQTAPARGTAAYSEGVTARSSSRRSLRRAEAEQRAATLAVHGYRVRLDLTGEDGGFGSVTTVRFASTGEDTFVDLQPRTVHTVMLNGASVPTERVVGGRLPLSPEAGENELVVDAEMAYRNDGEGLHRTVDPADGLAYVYAMSFMDAAPSFFACFDQPDLKAPLSLEVLAPLAWTVVGNAPGRCVEPGRWVFETTPPVSTYVVSLVAGPWHVLRETHDGIGLGFSARRSIARHLDADAEELFTLTRQCLDELHRLFGTRYPSATTTRPSSRSSTPARWRTPAA
jgi:aminopeptidase N